MKTTVKLKKDILKCMDECRHDAITFAELMEVEGFKGQSTFLNRARNQVYWHGLSDEAIGALKELLLEHKIIASPCSPEIYRSLGMWIHLPFGSRPNAKYKQEVWIPLAFAKVSSKMQ